MEAQNPSLKIYKSSAGSGKTYQLVLNYLSLILKSKKPDKFKRILAITFTNKASKEMKERVLQGLRKLKSGEDERFVQDYVASTGLQPHELSEKAAKLLTTILHNYGHLNILTIDKFIHRIIRSFSRELGLTTNFELTFDFDTITARCIDEVLQELGNDHQLTKVLVEYYQQLIDQEDNPNIERALHDKAKILNQEEAVEKLAFYQDKDLKFFEGVRKDIQTKLKEIRSESVDLKRQVIDLMGKDLPNLKNGNSKYYTLLDNLENTNSIPNVLSDAQIRNVEQNKWISKKAEKDNPELADLLNSNGDHLKSLFLKIDRNAREEIFLRKLDKNIMSFALLNDVQQQVEQLKKDNNLVLIGELNRIISEIIGKESAPYIYEKIGARFENYFVDEFQDTSELQWKNLIPLIHESLSNGHENLIVGDAKQSIYRWRGGNAQQFIDLPLINFDLANRQDVNRSFLNNHEGYVLEDNYRSSNAVISFNNWLFPKLIQASDSDFLANIYTDIQQNPKRKEEGLLEVTIYKPKTEYDKEHPYGKRLVEQIKESLADGYNFQDLCVLVRTNKEGAEIAQFLSSNNFPVTSQESLLLSDSTDVKLIYAFVKVIHRRTEENILRLFSLFQRKDLFDLFDKYRIPSESTPFYSKGYDLDLFLNKEVPNFDLTHYNELSIYDQVDYLITTLSISREDLYVDKLMNFVFDFQQRNGHHTGRFIEFVQDKVMNSSVVPPENLNAIRIMTIHKSKGLQFPVVIIPKRIENKNNEDVWISSDLISDLGMSEINMQPDKNSPDDKIKEVQRIQKELANLDLINLTYVAYTRAENRLYIHIEESRSTEIVKQQIALVENHKSYNPDSTSLLIGHRNKHMSTLTRSSRHELVLDSKETKNWRDTLILAIPESTDLDKHSFSERNWGLALHEILQNLDNLNNYNGVVSRFLHKNKHWIPYQKEISETVKSFADNSEIQGIYDNCINSLSERSLASSHGEVLRPDKVLEKEDQIIVIDFKTGHALPKHKQQILKYGHILEKIYPKPIDLYLIYLSKDKISVIHV